MPLIKAIENGREQTESLCDKQREMWCCRLCVSLTNEHEVHWNVTAKEGESPVVVSSWDNGVSGVTCVGYRA